MTRLMMHRCRHCLSGSCARQGSGSSTSWVSDAGRRLQRPGDDWSATPSRPRAPDRPSGPCSSRPVPPTHLHLRALLLTLHLPHQLLRQLVLAGHDVGHAQVGQHDGRDVEQRLAVLLHDGLVVPDGLLELLLWLGGDGEDGVAGMQVVRQVPGLLLPAGRSSGSAAGSRPGCPEGRSSRWRATGAPLQAQASTSGPDPPA
jgi:hypothetical protein